MRLCLPIQLLIWYGRRYRAPCRFEILLIEEDDDLLLEDKLMVLLYSIVMVHSLSIKKTYSPGLISALVKFNGMTYQLPIDMRNLICNWVATDLKFY